MVKLKSLAGVLCACLVVSCSSLSRLPRLSGGWTAVDTKTREKVSMRQMADALQGVDVVFLGEEHDNTVGHRLQFELVRELFARRGELVITLEMFETDVEFDLQDYLAGKLSEEEFLERSRPWPNYNAHYRPIVEWAKKNGVRVVAGNIPRPVARQVAYEGIGAVRKERWMPAEFEAPKDEYLGLFQEAMGGKRGDPLTTRSYNWYSAQCVKDEVMAESIVRWTDGKPTDPLVVHLCGKFHSDRRLGTAARVLRRRPHFEIAVVSTKSGTRGTRGLDAEDWLAGDYLWLVRSE